MIKRLCRNVFIRSFDDFLWSITQSIRTRDSSLSMKTFIKVMRDHMY